MCAIFLNTTLHGSYLYLPVIFKNFAVFIFRNINKLVAWFKQLQPQPGFISC